MCCVPLKGWAEVPATFRSSLEVIPYARFAQKVIIAMSKR